MENQLNAGWRQRPERGTDLALRLIIRIALHTPRWVCRLLLVPICLYFFATAPGTRHASRAFLSRVRGRPAGVADVFAHLYCFATTILDRAYLLTGREDRLAVEVRDEHVLREALALGRGCLLLGSHLGSFELLGVVGSVDRRLPINVVMNVDANARIHGLLADRGGGLPYTVIALGSAGAMLRVRECLQRGEIVGVLADRVYADEATCALPFLGTEARFTLAPYRLAAITGAPVVMAYAIFLGGRSYRVSFSPLAERIELDHHRQGVVPWARRYVAGLEARAREQPLNWFNFYDYWAAPQ